MSASQQRHINAILQEQLQLLTQKYELLANDYNERLTKLEQAAESARSSIPPAHRLSTAMETTIRRSSQEQLSNLVVRLCNRDDAAQKLTAYLLDGGANSQQTPAPPTTVNAVLPGPSKRRASRAFSSSMKTCKNCKERYSPESARREGDECWYHPGKFILNRFAQSLDHYRTRSLS